MKCGDNLIVEIIGLDHFGRGIAKIDDKIIFVGNALPKEKVKIIVDKVKKNIVEASVLEYLETSSNRIEPVCPYFYECGGCDLMHLDYLHQLEYKENKVKEIMHKFAGIDNARIKNIMYSENAGYRNKATFKVDNGIGFYKKSSNDVVKIDSCYISNEKINKIIGLLHHTDKIKEIIIRASKYTNDCMLIIDGKLDDCDLNRVKEFVTSIYIKDGKSLKNIYGNDSLYEKLGDYVFKILPSAFFQVNTKCAEKMYDKVKEYLDLTKDDIVLDLYCGTGSIGIYISDTPKKVLGIEINDDAIKSARENAVINNVKNIEFICSPVEKIINNIDINPNKIVVDPPRAGLDKKTIEYLNKVKVDTLVYVSCDSVTLARDLKSLDAYEVKEITPFDMFSNTYHVECVTLLQKKSFEK